MASDAPRPLAFPQYTFSLPFLVSSYDTGFRSLNDFEARRQILLSSSVSWVRRSPTDRDEAI